MKAFLLSFTHAIDGIRLLIVEERNYFVHILASIGVIAVAIILKAPIVEICVLAIMIGLVLATETLNTAIENIMDFVCLEKREQIRKIKDLSAAAVLITAIVAAFVGSLIFIPKIINLL